MDRNLKYNIVTLCFLLNMLFIFCNSKNENHSKYSSSPIDTSTLEIDSAKKVKTENDTKLPSSDSKKEIGNDLKKKRKDLLNVLQSEILFDGDFKPHVSLKLANNSRFSIIGLHFNVYPHKQAFENDNQYYEKCDIAVQKKFTIPPGKTVVINQKIDSPNGEKCDYNNGTILINGVVYSNGKRISGLELMTGDTTLQSID